MQTSNHPGYRRPGVRLRAVAFGLAMLATAPAAWAWGPKSYYPTGFQPTMPNAEEARSLRSEPPVLFRALGQAHRQSLQRGWQGGIAQPRADATAARGAAPP